MKRPRLLIQRSAIVLLGAIASSIQGCAQHSEPIKADSCFVLRMHHNDRRVYDPITVIFVSREGRKAARWDDGKVCLPDGLDGFDQLDIYLRVKEDVFYLPSVSKESFQIPWDFYFGERKYAYLKGVPKSLHPAHACTIEFRSGEPGTAEIYSNCRRKATKADP